VAPEVEALPEPVHKDDIADRRRQRELIERFEDVARVYGQYQPWLREQGFVDYGDLLLESVRLFESDSVAADIHDRYRHILVDEFQDINYASGRLIRELDGGRQVTWAVGDPKQSIFRFQGASVRNLLAFQDDFPGARVIPLQTNYRSVAEIVATGEAIKFPSSSGQQRQHLFPAALTAARGSTPAGPVLRVARVGTQADEHAWMADEIRALQQTGMPLGDTAILCRKREQAQAVSGYLEGQGIATNWDGILQNNPLFKDMTAVIGLAADDPKALVRLASVPEHALAEADVRALLRAVERSQSLSHALRRARDGKVSELSEEGRQGAVRLLDLYHQLLQRPMPWAVFAAYLFELSQWPRALLHDDSLDGARSRATLGQVADLLRGFWSRGAAVADGQGAREFLRYVALAIESGRLETGTATATPRRPDAVNVLTMHGSKGLQWPVVFLPHQVEDTWKPSTDGDLPLPRFLPRDKDPLDSDEFEEACLLYVALTRAQDRLFVSSQSREDSRAAGKCVPIHLFQVSAKLW
jgi:DNA helicase-2/ATP-dependent DNA helicase PcrA